MAYQNIPSDFIRQIEQEAATIRSSTPTIDIPAYLARWLPMLYPNKGVKELIAEGRTIEIHHEAFTADMVSMNADRETFLQHYGNSHQRDYCYIVDGHRWSPYQHVQFRGVLGLHRLFKLALALLLAGCPADKIRLIDHQPDYQAQVRRDLAGVEGPLDLIVIGGLVVAGHTVPPELTPGYTFTGEVISGQVWTLGQRRLLLTTFPYGDLSFHATQALLEKEPIRLLFTGAAGSLSPMLEVGDICIPQAIADETVSSVAPLVTDPALLTLLPDVKSSALHGSIRTPLLETYRLVATFVQKGVTSLDVEAFHFHRACRANPRAKTGILLYISDMIGIGAGADLGQITFSDLRSARRQITEALSCLLEAS